MVPGVLPDGSSYEPLVFTDAQSSIGFATLQDQSQGLTTALVAVSGDNVRLLRSYGASNARATATAGDGDVYWLEIEVMLDGTSRTSAWRANLADGTQKQLATDSGRTIVGESAFDLTLVNGRLYWIVKAAQDGFSELHSVDVAGGPVTARRLPGSFTLRNWPWAVTSGQGLVGPLTLLNLESQETITVVAKKDQVLDCTSDWCHVTTLLNGGQHVEHGLMRPDRSGYRMLSRVDGRYPVSPQALLLNRFDFQGQTAPGDWQPDQLWLLDVARDRTVLASASYSLQFGTHDSYVWWSSGDNEALQWNLLDLRQLAD
jgi:hypothetical protein